MPFTIIHGAYYSLYTQEGGTEWRQQPSDDSLFASASEIPEQYELFPPCVVQEAVFQELLAQWRVERGTTSSATEIVLCNSYQAIIAMGPTAIPFILAQMEGEGEHPDHWFWALQMLTGSDPVREEDEGDFRKMAKSWIEWARSRYVW